MKRSRQKLITDLVEAYSIGTQEELLAMLAERGYDVTQATVSRDVKELRLTKTLDDKGDYRYTVEKNATDDTVSKFNSIFSESVISTDYAGHMCVVRCYAGLAQAACAAFDSMNFNQVLGTLAGDDTIFILCKDEKDASIITTTINKMLKF
ncbi:MAG: arginine repressor [Clostridiales bacterium]|jgi:transcriptional regulator of arginine metabolism|nr:arginine repressor [Clostridiales bacterium]